MTTKQDIDILIDAHDEATRTCGMAARTIADELLAGLMPTETHMKAYAVAKLGMQSTARDLEDSINIAATIAASGEI